MLGRRTAGEMIIPLRDNATSYDTPYVTLGLILTCIVVFALQWLHPQGFMAAVNQWGEVPTRIIGGQPVPGTGVSSYWTMFTAMFMHADGWHIAGNMIALWLFGDNIEWLLGRVKFLLFYLACGLVSSGFTLLVGWESNLPGIGASGAIAGVMAAYLIFYPRAKITSIVWFGFSVYGLAAGNFLPHLRNISAVWFIGTWVLLQVALAVYLLGLGVFYNLGIYAHAAGAAAGALLVWPLVIPERRPKPTDHEVSDELTTILIGEEGDAGGNEPVYPTLAEEVAKLRESGGRRSTFEDTVAEGLIAHGDYASALKHAREMLEEACEIGDAFRESGYRELIREIEKKYNPPPERLKPRPSIIPEEKRRHYDPY